MGAWPASVLEEQFGADTQALVASGDIYGPQGVRPTLNPPDSGVLRDLLCTTQVN